MRTYQRLSCRLSYFALAWIFAAGVSQGAIVGVSASNADAYFGSQSDVYQASNPTGLNPWTPVGLGPYFGTALPGVPAPPGGNSVPSNVTPLAPSPATASFNDGSGNLANSTIVALVTPPGNNMNDAQIALSMQLTQSGSTYAYEQVNYSADYSLTNGPNGAGFISGVLAGNVSRSYAVSGTVGSFADFGGQMNFWDVPVSGPATLLGQLVFSYNNTSPGAFSTVVTGSGFIGLPPGYIDNPETLRITGDFFVAGDPSSITVESVPEPSSLVLTALGIVGLFVAARRRQV
jgi:PEP-CTERM motif